MKLSNITVIKRNNIKEPFNHEKILQHLEESCKNLTDVNPSDIIANLRLKLKNEMYSKDIQKLLIQSTQELISNETPNYDKVAGRLLNQDLRKDIYGQYKPVFNADIIKQRIRRGLYDKELFDFYTEDEVNKLIEVIDWERDDNFTYLGLTQMIDKYSVKRNNKTTETPQEIFFLIPLYNFMYSYTDKEKRFQLVKEFYHSLSKFEIMLSTPPMVGIRTSLRGFTSCAGLMAGDSVESLGNAVKNMMTLTTKLRAGIGMNSGAVRGVGADINNGQEKHTGILPYLKVFEYASKSSQQPASGRSGAVTNYYPFFHYEIENILQIKNNKGTEETRVRQSDHCIVFNELFYERLEKEENITLFHINEVQDLYERIGDKKYFKEKYEELERTIPKRKKRTVSAKLIHDTYWNERFGNGRMYKLYAEAMYEHSAFELPIYTSNLCTEIALPSYADEFIHFNCDLESQEQVNTVIEELYEKGKWFNLYSHLQYNTDLDQEIKDVLPGIKRQKRGEFKYNFGEIFSCILGGVNFGVVKPKDFERVMNLMVRFLDAMIDYQDYAGVHVFEKSAKNRRTLGISPSNLFYLLAKHNADYDSLKAKEIISEYMEYMLFYGIKASVELAKEKGACKYFNDTKYSKGITPLDTYNRNVDYLVPNHNFISTEEWNTLKEEIQIHGMRNSTLLTAVPASNSSRVSNSISGINPPQKTVYTIEDKKVNIKAVVPNLKRYKGFYERNTGWNINSIEYFKMVAVIQKYIDQAISLNQYNDMTQYQDNKIPYSEILKQDAICRKYGIKSLYYSKTKTDNQEQEDLEETGCTSGGCEL